MSDSDQSKKDQDSGSGPDESGDETDQEYKIRISKLREELWNICGEGKLTRLQHFFKEHQKEDYESFLNEENEDFEEDGAHVLMFCVKEGCDHAPTKDRNYPGCIRLLNEKGAKIDQKDKAKRTSLHWSVFYKNVQIVKELLDLKADVNEYDQDNVSPYHLSILLGFKETFQVLSKDRDSEVSSVKWVTETQK